MKFLMTTILMASFSSVFAAEYSYESSTSCKTFEHGIGNMNKYLPDDLKLNLECSNAENGKTRATLYTNSIALCSTSEYVYNEVHTFGRGGAFLGWYVHNSHPTTMLLRAFGMIPRVSKAGTPMGTLSHDLHELQFPHCEN